MNRPFNCPACGSDRIQKARILRRAGIPLSSEVEKKISPPAEPTSHAEPAGRLSVYLGTFFFAIGIYTLGTGNLVYPVSLFLQVMGVTLILLGLSLLALSQIELNAKRPKYQQDYDKWERLWYCSHCKNPFYDA